MGISLGHSGNFFLPCWNAVSSNTAASKLVSSVFLLASKIWTTKRMVSFSLSPCTLFLKLSSFRDTVLRLTKLTSPEPTGGSSVSNGRFVRSLKSLRFWAKQIDSGTAVQICVVTLLSWFTFSLTDFLYETCTIHWTEFQLTLGAGCIHGTKPFCRPYSVASSIWYLDWGIIVQLRERTFHSSHTWVVFQNSVWVFSLCDFHFD